MSDTENLQQNQPVEFEARNFRPGYKRLQAGDCYLANVEVDEETWNTLKTIPRSALLKVILYWHEGDDEAPKTKGIHGDFWQAMFKKGALNSLDLHQVLNVQEGEDPKLCLHKVFDTDSLTYVSPEQFAEWATNNQLHALAAMANQIAGGR
jgi:hypothetical protein